MSKIGLFTMAVGNDPIYFDSVRRYFPYNQNYFGEGQEVDYFLLTDRKETIDGIKNIPCLTSVWPYTTLLKNNAIANYLDEADKWDEYSHIFFIDADFAIGDHYDFFKHDFVLVKPYWNNKNGGGFFYGGTTEYFKKLCSLFREEIQFIYEKKLSVPRDLDEFYLGLFREQHQAHIHLIEMDRQTNTLIFYDNEDLDEKIRQNGTRLFMQPYKAEGRANKTIVTDVSGKTQECIVNLEEQYIFNNYSYDYGRLLKIDNENYRILWSKQPEVREVINIETLKIHKQTTDAESAQLSPVLSIVMPVYNVPPDYLRESIDSILKQTFGDFELLIINDGSTELEGIELIKSYDDKRIRLITKEHDFIASLNKGVAESRGKYIVRMDADDIMLPNRLAVQYEFMEEHLEVDVCGSWMEIFGNGSGKIQTHTEHKQIVSSLLLSNSMAHPTVILRKSSVCPNGEPIYQQGYDCAEDYKLWTDLAMKGLRFANVPEVLLLYRSSGNQVTSTRQKEMYDSTRKIQTEYAENLNENKKMKAQDEKKVIDRFAHLFPMVKLFIVADNLYAYDAKANFLTEVTEENLKQLCDFHNDKLGNTNTDLSGLIQNGVFLSGPLKKIVPLDNELNAIIDYQLKSYIPRKFTIEITEACTLRCKYCLFSREHEVTRKHTSQKMKPEIAYQAVDYYFKLYTDAIQKLPANQIEKLLEIAPPTLTWWGGEPFLNFELMVETKKYFESLPWNEFGVNKEKFVYSTVTNLTILNEAIIEFITNNNFYLFVSLDGGEEENDTNRVFPNGKGSFDVVMKNLEHLITHYPEFAKKRLTVQSVLADNLNIQSVHEFFIHHFNVNSNSKKILKYVAYPQRNEREYLGKSQKEEINAKEIISTFFVKLKELSSKTTEELHSELTSNEYLAAEFAELFSLENSLTFDNPQGTDYQSNLFSCPLGIDMIFISINGDIHTCNKSDYSLPLGNIKKGIDTNLIKNLYSNYLVGFRNKCLSCWAFRFCKVCPANLLNEKEFCYPTEEECFQIRKLAFIRISKYILLILHENLYKNLEEFYFRNEKKNFLNYKSSINIQ